MFEKVGAWLRHCAARHGMIDHEEANIGAVIGFIVMAVVRVQIEPLSAKERRSEVFSPIYVNWCRDSLPGRDRGTDRSQHQHLVLDPAVTGDHDLLGVFPPGDHPDCHGCGVDPRCPVPPGQAAGLISSHSRAHPGYLVGRGGLPTSPPALP